MVGPFAGFFGEHRHPFFYYLWLYFLMIWDIQVKMKPIHIFKGMTRNVFILGWVSLFTDLSSQMVFPLIPLFLTTILGTGAAMVGVVEGAAETTASLLKVVSGYWSDKIKKRKPFLLLGYGLSSVTKPLFAMAHTCSFVVFIRVMERIGKGLRSAPRDALVAESCDARIRGKAYGFQRAMDGIGSVAGALLAFLLLPAIGYRRVFLLAFFPSIIAVAALLFIREKKTVAAGSPATPLPVKLRFKALPLNLRWFVLVSSLFSLGHFGYAFLLLRASNIGYTDSMAILFYALFYLVYTVCAIPFGILSDKIGRKPILIAGYLAFGITCTGLLFTPDKPGMAWFFAAYGMFYAMVDGAQRAFVVDLSPMHLKATCLGVFHTAIGMVALPGGFIAGLLWDKINPEATFAFGLAVSILSAGLFFFVKGRPEQQQLPIKPQAPSKDLVYEP